jgi:CHAD domain-containing protein
MLAFELYVDQPDRCDELHKLRIAAKRLRYTMEIFEPAYEGALDEPLESAKQIQKTLGKMHDCDVWIGFLPVFLEEERERILAYFGHTRPFGRLTHGIEFLREQVTAQRSGHYADFRAVWRESIERGIWRGLLETLGMPAGNAAKHDVDGREWDDGDD